MNITKLVGIGSVLFATHWALAQQPPQITQQPTNTTVELGGNAQLKVTVQAGSAPLEYLHWRFKDAPLDTNAIPSAATPILTFNQVTLAQAGPYFAVATDTAGLSATSQVAVLGIRGPLITLQPTNTTVSLGGTAQFKVWVATVNPPVTYGWYFKDAAMDAVANPSVAKNLLSLTNVTTAQDGTYFVVVSNSVGSSSTSQVAVLTVYPAYTMITTQPTNTTASLGATVQFTAAATSTRPPITWQWYFKEAALDAVANPSAAKQTLSLTNVTLAQDGPYFVVASDAALTSATSQVATLIVDPTFTKITTGPPVTDLGNGWNGTWRDYDGDGFDDLLVNRYPVGKNTIYLSNGDGTFTSVPYSAWGVDGMAYIWGDLDSDGLPDLVTWKKRGEPYSVWFNNSDGTFSQVKMNMPMTWGCIALVDFDQDGMLDVFESGLGNTNRLYRNIGNRTFVHMTSEQVGSVCAFKTYGGGSWADYDDDGWVDLYSANIDNDGPSRLHHNQGGGRFEVAINQANLSSFNGDWGDYDSDGRVDLCLGRPVLDSPGVLYQNLGNGEFEERDSGDGIPASHNCNSTWADYDNDGFLDLIRDWISDGGAVNCNTLAHNNGDGTFSRITTGSIVTDTLLNGSGVGASLWFDYDNDGFPDLYVGNGNNDLAIYTANFLYHNNGNANAWLKVKLIGTASNRDAIGAKVGVQAKFAGQLRWQRRDLVEGDTWCFNRPYAHFGLGDATNVDLVRIEWPSGLVQELQNVSTNQTLQVTEHQDGVNIAPTLTATRSTEGAVQLTLTGQANLLYVFEGSTNLVQWTKLGVRTNLTGTVEFTDTWAAQYAQRFYRGVAP